MKLDEAEIFLEGLLTNAVRDVLGWGAAAWIMA
jgi:hypothetical protein